MEMKEKIDGLYTNIGKKIQILAKVVGIIAVIGGVLAFLISGFDHGFDEFAPWMSLLSGLAGFVFSWPLYGFGNLVENVQKLTETK